MTPVVATLYTRAGCHLCEDALADLARLQPHYPHTLRLVDIATDPVLLDRYGDRIPVLEIGGHEYAAPLPRAVLEQALREPAATAMHGDHPGVPTERADREYREAARLGWGSLIWESLGAATRHWLLTLNLALGVFLAGGLLAPTLAAVGQRSAADAIYAAYHLTCHQWAFRSFFLFAPQLTYSQPQLIDLGWDPYTFVGSPELGWKMAFCERDLAIYLGLLLVGIAYARARSRNPRFSVGQGQLKAEPFEIGFLAYGALSLPMALDGFTQLFGWRESTWELRLLTGMIFGLASAALVLPRLDAALAPHAATGGRPDSAGRLAATQTRRTQAASTQPDAVQQPPRGGVHTSPVAQQPPESPAVHTNENSHQQPPPGAQHTYAHAQPQHSAIPTHASPVARPQPAPEPTQAHTRIRADTHADIHTHPDPPPAAADPEAADPEATDPEAADPEATDPEAADPEGEGTLASSCERLPRRG